MQTSTAITTGLDTACNGGTGNTGDTCEDAISNLADNTACITAVNGGTDVDTFCSETCRNLLAPIVSNCDASVSQTIAIENYFIFYVIASVIYF